MTQARTNDTICWRPVDYYVYLIHFSTPLHHARHYLGATSALDARLLLHRNGNGARLMEVIGEHHIAWEVARLWRVDTWEESRDLEHKLKRRHNSPRLCPLCQGKPLDAFVLVRQGHYRLSGHVGRRRPAPVYRNVPFERRFER